MFARLNLLAVTLHAGAAIFGASANRAFAQVAPNAAIPFEPNKLPRVKLVEDLRLDAATEDFSSIRRLSVSQRGIIAVALGQDFQVRLYDSTGKRIGAVGRKGGGPGEFQNVTAVSWVGDTLFVLDMSLHRVSYFSPDAKLLRTASIPSGRNMTAKTSATDTNYFGFGPFAGFANGGMIGEARLSVGAKPQTSRGVLVKLSTASVFRLVTTLPAYEDERWMMSSNGFGNPIPFALQPQIHWTTDGSKMVFLTADQRAGTGKLFVLLCDSSGKTLYNKTFTFRGTSIPSSVADSEINAAYPLKVAEPEGPPNSQWQALARKLLPATYSPAERIVIGSDGRAWLTLRANPSGQDVVVLDERGNPVVIAGLSKGVRLEQASAGHVWTTQRDADGQPSVVRYRLTK